MLRISTDKLEPGMKLARPVTRGEMLLLGKDTELTDELINKIRGMEISSIYVCGSSQPDMPKEEALAQLDRRFKNVKNRPYMNLLKKIVKEHIEGLYD